MSEGQGKQELSRPNCRRQGFRQADHISSRGITRDKTIVLLSMYLRSPSCEVMMEGSVSCVSVLTSAAKDTT